MCLRLVAFVLVLASVAASQSAHVLQGPGVIAQALPSTACTFTEARPIAYGALPLASTLPPLGGHAFDHSTNLVYASTGPTVAVVSHPNYPPAVAVPSGPHLLPSIPCAVSGASMGPVTGLAAAPGALLLTDGTCIAGVSSLPPFVPTVPPFPAHPAGWPTNVPVTGLEWEGGALAILRVTDAMGRTWGMTLGGPVVDGPYPFPAGGTIGPIIGNVFDRSVPPGRHWVTDATLLYPVDGGTPVQLPIPAIWQPPHGASFVADPLSLGGQGQCGGYTALAYTIAPTVAGLLPAPFGIRVSGGPPAANAWLCIDTTCGPPIASGPAGTWWLPYPSQIQLGPFLLDATGSSTYIIGPLPPIVGLEAYAQWLVDCPPAPFGLMASNALHARISLP